MTLETDSTASRGSADTAGGAGGGGGLRAAAAVFWLTALFRLTAAAPALLRAIKPLFVRCAFLFSPKIRASTAANARWIFGSRVTPSQRRAFGRRVVASFYDFVYDIGRSSRATRQELVDRIEAVDGLDTYRNVRAAGKGAIVLTAHMGSFEVGLAALAQHEPRIHVVFRRDRFGAFENMRSALRQRLNVSEAPLDDGWTVWVRLRDALQQNEVVAIQGDRVMPGQKGMVLPFLHGHAELPTGPAKLALASGAPIVPIFSIRTARGNIRIVIEEPVVVAADSPDPVGQAMRKIASVLGKRIAAHPEQWLVLDPTFCEDADDAGQRPINA